MLRVVSALDYGYAVTGPGASLLLVYEPTIRWLGTVHTVTFRPQVHIS